MTLQAVIVETIPSDITHLTPKLKHRVFSFLGPVSSICLGLTSKSLYAIYLKHQRKIKRSSKVSLIEAAEDPSFQLHHYLRTWMSPFVWHDRWSHVQPDDPDSKAYFITRECADFWNKTQTSVVIPGTLSSEQKRPCDWEFEEILGFTDEDHEVAYNIYKVPAGITMESREQFLQVYCQNEVISEEVHPEDRYVMTLQSVHNEKIRLAKSVKEGVSPYMVVGIWPDGADQCDSVLKASKFMKTTGGIMHGNIASVIVAAMPDLDDPFEPELFGLALVRAERYPRLAQVKFSDVKKVLFLPEFSSCLETARYGNRKRRIQATLEAIDACLEDMVGGEDSSSDDDVNDEEGNSGEASDDDSTLDVEETSRKSSKIKNSSNSTTSKEVTAGNSIKAESSQSSVPSKLQLVSATKRPHQDSQTEASEFSKRPSKQSRSKY